TAGSCLQVKVDRPRDKCFDWCTQRYGDCPYGKTGCKVGGACRYYCALEEIKKECVVMGEQTA
ncbi:hypothetical protein CSKR_108191, partial [Clonorchis sinensis]